MGVIVVSAIHGGFNVTLRGASVCGEKFGSMRCLAANIDLQR